MVGADGITDVGLLLELLGNLGTIECVRHLALLVGHLSNIVEQSRTLGLLGIQAQLCGHDGTEVGGLTGMLQQVLAV